MAGWFRIDVEPSACLVRLTMGGFFDSATIAAMRRDLVVAIAALPCVANAHVTLCDIREMDIQSQERVEEFARLVGSDDIRSRRLAFVTAKSLARLQARRLTSREGVEFFSEIKAALDWLHQ
jgi:SpoU rRNA methylase family enzyme